MEQNTDKWLQWRKSGIGSSDAPIIMGVSSYKTPFQLWQEKTGKSSPEETNWAMRRGIDMEPKARAHYELLNNKDMPAALAQHKDFPFLRASLDGFNGETVLEIKCAGKEDHMLAKSGRIPEKYWPQVQHQLMVTGAKEVHYCSFDGNEAATVIVHADMDYLENLLAQELVFWQYVLNEEAPPLSDKDYKQITDIKLQEHITQWKLAKNILEEAELAEQALRTVLDNWTKSDHPKLEFGDVQITRTTRQGSIDYSKIPAIQNENLEAYRKKGSDVFTIRIKK